MQFFYKSSLHLGHQKKNLHLCSVDLNYLVGEKPKHGLL